MLSLKWKNANRDRFPLGLVYWNEGRITYRGYVRTNYNNLWGKARELSGRVDMKYQEGVNYIENRIALSYYEPFIFGKQSTGTGFPGP